MGANLTIYFATHHPTYPDPILSKKFVSLFMDCQTFILECAERWQETDRDRENRYYQLSQGTLNPTGALSLREGILNNLADDKFTMGMQQVLFGKKKEIRLEQPPLDPSVDHLLDIRYELELGNVNAAISVYRKQFEDMASSMTVRDDELVGNILNAALKSDKTVLVFRGAAHERYLSNMLERESIKATAFRYEKPSLVERILFSLTENRNPSEEEFMRSLLADLADTTKDYRTLLSNHAKYETMDKDDLLKALEKTKGTSS